MSFPLAPSTRSKMKKSLLLGTPPRDGTARKAVPADRRRHWPRGEELLSIIRSELLFAQQTSLLIRHASGEPRRLGHDYGRVPVCSARRRAQASTAAAAGQSRMAKTAR